MAHLQLKQAKYTVLRWADTRNGCSAKAIGYGALGGRNGSRCYILDGLGHARIRILFWRPANQLGEGTSSTNTDKTMVLTVVRSCVPGNTQDEAGEPMRPLCLFMRC